MNRRATRMKAHYDNDIWTKREKPPTDWAKPLPAFMEERNENTYLRLKNDELKAEEEEQIQQLNRTSEYKKSEPTKSTFCTFM